MAASMKMTAFWDRVLCSVFEVDQYFIHCPDEEVVFTSEASGLLQQDYTALYPRRLPSSYMFI
jgi:hypothetical protein